MQKLSLVCDALRNRRTVQFFTQVLESSYSTHFHHAKGIRVLNEAIELLIQSQKPSASVSKLRKAGIYCHKRIYRNKENAWLMNKYMIYKSKLKVRHNFESIKRWIYGRSVLDFGSGDGYFAHHLCHEGFRVRATDVHDHRSSKVQDFSFSVLSPSNMNDLFSGRYDTTIMNCVLHHINPNIIDDILSNIHKCTRKRVLIKEDIYLTDNVIHMSNINERSRYYMKLSSRERMQFLGLMDFYGNYVVQGIFSMNLPLQFFSLDLWRTVLGKHKIIVRHTIPQLFDNNMVHTGPQTWLICDVT